jgi:hypothetical protein
MGSGECSHTATVVAVLVGDQDGIDVFGGEAPEAEPIFNFLFRQTTINKDKGLARVDQRRVPLATTSEGRYPH